MPVNKEARQQIQNDTTARILEHWGSGRNVLLKAPTGFGKTHITSDVEHAYHLTKPDDTVMVIQETIKLTEQNAKAARHMGRVDNAVWTNGNFGQNARTIYTTPETAIKALEAGRFPRINAAIIDEAHQAPAPSSGEPTEFSTLIDAIRKRNPNAVFLGSTATPDRSDHRPLHPILANAEKLTITNHQALNVGAIVGIQSMVPDWTTKDGKSAKDTMFSMVSENDRISKSDITRTHRDMRPDNFNQTIIDKWQEHAGGKPTFAYVETTHEADELVRDFNARGIPAEAVHYKKGKHNTDTVLDNLATGKTKVAVGADMLSTGVNLRELEVVLLAKNVGGTELAQIKGRPTREMTFHTPEGDRPKTHASLIDMSATSYTQGLAETAIDIETLIHHGSKTAGLSPWKNVGKTDGQPTLALSMPEETFYAIRRPEPDASGRKLYDLYAADKTNEKKTKGTTIRKLRAGPSTGNQANILAREMIRQHPEHFSRAESITYDGQFISGVRELNPDRQTKPSLLSFYTERDFRHHGKTLADMHRLCMEEEAEFQKQSSQKARPANRVRRQSGGPEI